MTSWQCCATADQLLSKRLRGSKWNAKRFTLAHMFSQSESLFLGFNNLQHGSGRAGKCESISMNFTLVLLAIQILVTILAFVRESGEDERFAGDKLGYRS